MGRKFGGGLRSLFWERGAVFPCNTKSPRAEAYLHTKWNLDLCSHLAATDMGRKLGEGLCPFEGRGGGSPSNTMLPGPSPTCLPSFILIRQTVRPQYTNVTDRTDNDPIAEGKPFYKRSPKNPENLNIELSFKWFCEIYTESALCHQIGSNMLVENRRSQVGDGCGEGKTVNNSNKLTDRIK